MKKSEALNILGLQDGANDDDIKRAHRKLVIENHPDKFGQDTAARAKAEEKTKLINEARDVLLSRKWDPEYSTAGSPYGVPFSYNPYTSHPRGASGTPGGADNPFAGWPFEGVNFVWTTWDAQGNPHTYRPGDGSNPFGGNSANNPFSTANPFTGSIPFDFSGFGTPLTPKQRLASEKRTLKLDLQFIAIKAVILILCCVFFLPALGFYLYTVISIIQSIYKKLKLLSGFLAVPLLLIAFVFLPIATSPVGLIMIPFFAIALGVDIKNLRDHFRLINALKRKIDQEPDPDQQKNA